MENLLIIFIVVSSVAIVIQAGVLIALYIGMKKSSARMEAVAKQVEERALPVLDSAQALLTANRPKIDTVVDNLLTTTSLARSQMERLDITVSDIVDRTRLQVIRTDEMVSRALDRVEETTEMVHHTVLSPVRQLSGLVQGLMTGIGAYFGRRSPRQSSAGGPDDEMFI